MQELLHQEYAQREKKAPLRKAAREVLERLDADGTSAVILSNHLLGSIQEQCRRLDLFPLIRDFLANRNLEEQMHFPPKGERLRSYMVENKINAAQTIIVGDTPI
jgi:phosphoglycolate phosphatase-like HAD superfamily hydrolase